VWDNLLAIATDLAVFEDTLRAYNRILDLKQQEGHVDAEVLAILVRVVTEGLPDSSGYLIIIRIYTELILKNCVFRLFLS
jgi:hypothetical protein